MDVFVDALVLLLLSLKLPLFINAESKSVRGRTRKGFKQRGKCWGEREREVVSQPHIKKAWDIPNYHRITTHFELSLLAEVQNSAERIELYVSVSELL